MWDKFCGWVRVLLTPECWTQIHQYSEEWDRKLNELMATERFRSDGSMFTVQLGTFRVWVSNHPYASMGPYYRGLIWCRPRRITVLRAHDKMVRDLIEESVQSTNAAEGQQLTNNFKPS